MDIQDVLIAIIVFVICVTLGVGLYSSNVHYYSGENTPDVMKNVNDSKFSGLTGLVDSETSILKSQKDKAIDAETDTDTSGGTSASDLNAWSAIKLTWNSGSIIKNITNAIIMETAFGGEDEQSQAIVRNIVNALLIILALAILGMIVYLLLRIKP